MPVSDETIKRVIDDLESRALRLEAFRSESPRVDTACRVYEYAADQLRQALQDG